MIEFFESNYCQFKYFWTDGNIAWPISKNELWSWRI